MRNKSSPDVIGNRENLSRRVLSSGAQIEEIRMNHRLTLRIPAGPERSMKIWICHQGDVWVKGQKESRVLKKDQALEVAGHLPKIVFGSETKESRVTIFRTVPSKL